MTSPIRPIDLKRTIVKDEIVDAINNIISEKYTNNEYEIFLHEIVFKIKSNRYSIEHIKGIFFDIKGVYLEAGWDFSDLIHDGEFDLFYFNTVENESKTNLTSFCKRKNINRSIPSIHIDFFSDWSCLKNEIPGKHHWVHHNGMFRYETCQVDEYWECKLCKHRIFISDYSEGSMNIALS